MSLCRLDVLIAVEDPGAANFVLELPEAFERAGTSSKILAFGHAREYLLERHVDCLACQFGTAPQEYVNTFLPRLLLAGTSQNPDSPVLALIDEFKQRRLPTVAFVDMAADAHLRFRGRSDTPFNYEPDYLLVVDLATKSAFLNLGFPTDRIFICGHPAYDRVRRRAKELAKCDLTLLRMKVLGSDPSPRPVWVFAAEHGADDPRQRRSAEYTLHGRGGSDRRVDIVFEEILDARALIIPRPFLALRLHPKNILEEFASYLPEVDIVSQGGDALELIWASDLVLGLSSIFLMEAAICGRATLSVVPRNSEQIWSPSVNEGLTPVVTTRCQLRGTLSKESAVTSVNTKSDSVFRIVDAVLGKLTNRSNKLT